MRISDWSSDVCSSDLPLIDGVHDSIIGQHRDDDVCLGCRIICREGRPTAQLDKSPNRDLIQIMCRKRIARLKQILGHGRTHVAKAYKCDMRHVVLSVLLAAHYCARVGIGLILPWKFARSSPSILSPLHPEEANLAFAQMGFM